jgi:hypothetical protein
MLRWNIADPELRAGLSKNPSNGGEKKAARKLI